MKKIYTNCLITCFVISPLSLSTSAEAQDTTNNAIRLEPTLHLRLAHGNTSLPADKVAFGGHDPAEDNFKTKLIRDLGIENSREAAQLLGEFLSKSKSDSLNAEALAALERMTTPHARAVLEKLDDPGSGPTSLNGSSARSEARGDSGGESPVSGTSSASTEARKADWRAEIKSFNREERKVYTRAKQIQGLTVGIDIESTLTTAFPWNIPEFTEIRSGILEELVERYGLKDIDLEELRSRLMTPGMKALVLGLLENNTLKIITTMRDPYLAAWRNTVPFLDKLLSSDEVELIDGNQVGEVSQKKLNFSSNPDPVNRLRVFYSLNNVELSKAEGTQFVNTSGEPLWNSLKIPQEFLRGSRTSLTYTKR